MTLKNSNKIVFVCQVYHPDESSTSQLFRPLMERFADEGYAVTVICGYAKGKKSLPKETLNGVNILRHGLNVDHKRGLMWRFAAYSSFILSVFLRLLIIKNGPRVIGVTNPPFNAHILALTSKIRSRKFDYVFLDLHPEGLIGTGNLSKDSYLTRIWMKLNKLAYKTADRLYVIGRDMKALVEDNYQFDSDRVTYMPHWSVNEGNGIINFIDSKYTKMLGLSDKFVIQYSGNMGLWHDMETFVRVAHLLLNDHNIQFVFVGGGIRYDSAKALSDQLGCSNILWRDFVAEKDLHESLAACHVSLITLADGLEGVAVPCKLYGILASARAIVSATPLTSEIALTLKDHNCGINMQPGDVRGLADAIKSLSQDRKTVLEMGLRGYDACRSVYSLENAYQNLN